MKRLVIFSYDFPSNNGGISRLCSEIYNQCHATRTPVLVITCCQGENKSDIIRIKEKRGLLDIKMFLQLKRCLKVGDIILTDTFHPAGFLAELTGYPTYILAHGAEYLPGNSFFRRKLFPQYRKHVLGKATKVIANSSYTKGLVLSCNPLSNVVALPLAVDNVHFHPTKDKSKDGLLHLCTISRLLKFKAQDFVIKTIAKLPNNYKSKIRFVIGGKGEYKTMLEKLVRDLHVEEIVHFCGFIPDNKLCDFYSENDVFILTTREEPCNNNVEGFGLVFTEAQACGTPTIGARTGGISDAIEEGNGGWLIEQDNEEELSKLLMLLIDNPNIKKIEGEKALKRIVNNCTWTIYFNHLKELLNE